VIAAAGVSRWLPRRGDRVDRRGSTRRIRNGLGGCGCVG
jgi:hypothetical protein